MKTKKHSTKPKKISKDSKRRELNAELALNSKETWKIPKELLIRYGQDLLLMFEEDKRMISMLPWRQKHNLTYDDLNYYCKKCPDLKNMMKEFKERAGLRIFEQSVMRGDTSMARFAMTMYSKDYRKVEKWRNNLKKELNPTQDNKQPINVYLQDFGSSGKVPDKTNLDKPTIEKNKD